MTEDHPPGWTVEVGDQHSPGESRAEGPGDPVVQLFTNQTADVVGFDDVG